MSPTTAGTSTSGPSNSSRTMIIEDSQPKSGEGSPRDTSRESTPAQGLLRLRGGPNSRPRVVWREDVIDNENMGRKSSKICCIYHKARKFNESEESSSDEDSDDSVHNEHSHHNQHYHHKSQARRQAGDGDETREGNPRSGEIQELSSDDEPNAYERTRGWKKIKGKRQSNDI